jgi:beta-mannosidase
LNAIFPKFAGEKQVGMEMKKCMLAGLFCQMCFLLTGQTTSQYIPLDTNWTFSEGGRHHWREAVVPGSVHHDLLRHGLLPDPFYGTNEQHIQWVETKDWEYKTTFFLTAEQMAFTGAVMQFQGLDTYADVYLNGALILEAGNMFTGYEIPVKEVLRQGENRLHLYFRSAVNKALPQWESNGFDYPADNDHHDKHTSVFTRKAPFHYGWDWGIRMVGCGIWQPAGLLLFNTARITDYHLRQLSVTEAQATLRNELEIDLLNPYEEDVTVTFTCLLNGREVQQTRENRTLLPGKNRLHTAMIIEQPERWMPAGWGAQPLYDFVAEVHHANGDSMCRATARTGLRSIRVVNEADSAGQAFYFEVNGKPLFAKGANYVPAHLLRPGTRDEYERLFADIRAAHMNMIRVWGGGVYEDARFYRLADEHGILVWQDFMFACTPYPADPAFLASVAAEAEYTIRRLRNHPSLVLWCGNNEVYEAIKYWGFRQRTGDAPYASFFPAYDKLFRQLLPQKVAELDSGRCYLHSSPDTANWGRKASLPYGDSHYWGVWYGREPFEAFDINLSRFMSEYGFQSLPEMKTIATFAPKEEQSLTSAVMQAHQKSSTGNQLIREYMEQYYQVPDSFEDFVYVGLLLQGHGMRRGMEAHRRNRPFCMGSLYWQLNDNWPVVSWSGIDAYGNWKALHYQARRAFAPILISLLEEEGWLNAYLISDEWQDRADLRLELQLIDFSGNRLWEAHPSVQLPGNSATKVFSEASAAVASAVQRKNACLVAVLKDTGGVSLAETVFYFEPPKHLNLPETSLTQAVEYGDGYCDVTLSTPHLAKDVFIEIPVQGARFSDNFFDLLPGETRTIRISSPALNPAEKTTITLKHLGGLH